MGEHHVNTMSPNRQTNGSPNRQTNGNGSRLRKSGGAFGGPNSTGSAAATMHQVVLHGPFGGPNSTGNGSHQEEHPVDQHPEHFGHQEEHPVDPQLEHCGHIVQDKEMIYEDADAKEKMPTPGSHTTTHEGSGKGTGNEQAPEKELMSDTKVVTGNEQGLKEMMTTPEQEPKEMMPAPDRHTTATNADHGSGHTGNEEDKSMMDKVSGKPHEAAAPAING